VRQHVNPLSDKYQQLVSFPDWSKLYVDLTQPLHLDIGCARGRFLLAMAQQQPEWNFFGLEIREPLVEQANLVRDELGLTNLHYCFCNANFSLRSLLESLPSDVLQRVTIQFPDPWFKKRHQKRRVVQPELVAVLADFLTPGGVIFLQSDVEAVAIAMFNCFQENPAFTRAGTWLTENPLPIPTERELFTLNQSMPVYRAQFVLNPGG
jgi:tRNA (guanine-N7-)-methyltransferase